MSSMDDALVQTYCMESGDMGFIVYSSQLLVSFFKECELVQASSLPTLSDGQAFQVSVRALLDLSVDAISLVDSSPALQALGCRGATFDGKIGLGSIKNEDIGITMPSFKSFINCLGHSQYFNHLLVSLYSLLYRLSFRGYY
ncbi:hypothetical protein EON65_29830 [archaeon]|nr:MAG: hypothetical protein EON65_29830 [archaeon]